MYSGAPPAPASAPGRPPGGGERPDHGARRGADDLLGIRRAPARLGLERFEGAHEPGAADDPTRSEHESDPHGVAPYPADPTLKPSVSREFGGGCRMRAARRSAPRPPPRSH